MDIEFLRDIGFNIKWKNTSYISENFSEVIENFAIFGCKPASNAKKFRTVTTKKRLQRPYVEIAMKFKGVTVELAKYGIH